MKPPTCWALGIVCGVGILSGCSGSDNVPPVMTPSGPIASVEEQRIPQSDALTSDESTLISQAESEPDAARLPDL